VETQQDSRLFRASPLLTLSPKGSYNQGNTEASVDVDSQQNRFRTKSEECARGVAIDDKIIVDLVHSTETSAQVRSGIHERLRVQSQKRRWCSRLSPSL